MSKEMDRVWAMADKLNASRQKNAASKSNYLSARDKAAKQAAKDNWLGPTLQGGLSGAATGFMMGGPMGALAGAGVGAGVGYAGHETFNNNPGMLQGMGSMAMMGAGAYRAANPVSGGGAVGDTAGRGLSLGGGAMSLASSLSGGGDQGPDLSPEDLGGGAYSKMDGQGYDVFSPEAASLLDDMEFDDAAKVGSTSILRSDLKMGGVRRRGGSAGNNSGINFP
jgi:hypothetical protein